MESVREYLIAITCSALLSGILCTLVDEKKGTGAMVKLLCGVFMSLTMISPLSQIRLREVDFGKWDIRQEGEIASEVGMEYARQAKMQIIKSRTEAYILDKASLFDLDLSVDVQVAGEDTPIPETVILRGRVSPYVKSRLAHMIESELSIPKENQRWMESDSG